MTTLTVCYPLTDNCTFDRQYYLSTHIPIVESAWGELGLQSAEVLFPAAGPQPLAAMAILRFTDQVSIDRAMASPGTLAVLDDVSNFTTIDPVIFRAND